MVEFSLPTEPSAPKAEMSDFRWLIHSLPKVGKTTLASFFDGAFFLRTEEGTKGISVYGLDANSWDDACKIVELLREESHQFRTVVIDTVERLYFYLTRQVAEDNGVSHISEIGYGRGWDECNIRLHNMLEALYAKVGVVLISHSRFAEKTVKGLKMSYLCPDLSGSPRSVVTGWVDEIIYLATEDVLDEEGKASGTQRVAYCQPVPEIEAGGRLAYMPAKIVLPSPRDGYLALKTAFEEAVKRFLQELEGA